MVRRAAIVLAAVVLLAAVHLPGRPSTLCTLRALTGVPCMFCGGTTAGVRLGRGDLLGALSASPLAVLGSVGFVLEPLGLVRLGRWRWLVLALVGLAAQLWQLQRYGFF